MRQPEENHLTNDQATTDDGYTKLLSFVMCGRNDNYQQDFKYRITTCLNFLSRNLAGIGRLNDVEILVTDWGSEEPLSEVLSLSEECAQVCRFLYVPGNVTKGIRPDGGFSTVHASNVAIRRASAKFVALTVADMLITESSLKALFHVMEGKTKGPFDTHETLFLLHRFNLSSVISGLKPSLDDWDRYLQLSLGSAFSYYWARSPRFQWDLGFTFSRGNIYNDVTGEGCAGGANGYLMHSSIWRQCRGVNEDMIYQGFSDWELGLRISQQYQLIDLLGLGVWTFHVDHEDNIGDKKSGIRKVNRDLGCGALQVNGEDWGLGNLDIESRTAQVKPVIGQYISEQTGQSSVAFGNSIEDLTSGDRKLISKHSEWSVTKLPMQDDEWERLCIISHYGLHLRPRKYLQIGIQDPSYALSVAQASPIVEIYDVGFSSKSLLEVVKHAMTPAERGYPIFRRFVKGDPASAFERLMESTDHSLNFDLVHVNIDFMGDSAGTQLLNIVQYLQPQAAILLSAADKEVLITVLRKIRDEYPNLCFWVCRSGRTGIIEASNSRCNSLKKLDDSIDSLALNFGKPPFFLRGGKIDRSLIWMIWLIKGPGRIIGRWNQKSAV